MSAPVVTDKWTGSFDCSVCRRKRLVAAEFSKTAIERHRKSGGPLKCKTCITELQTKERLAAESRRSQLVEHSEVTTKKEKARCRECVDKAVKSDELTTMKAKQDKVAEANEELRIAEAKGNAFEISKAASKVAALEAEHVTGLKPRVLGKGGRGRSRLRR